MKLPHPSALARRAADVQARAAASQQRTDDEIAQLDARRSAERTQMLAAISARKTQGHAQIDQARRTWQAEIVRVQRTHQRAVDDHHAHIHARIATLVHTGEHQVDTSLTHRESDAKAGSPPRGLRPTR